MGVWEGDWKVKSCSCDCGAATNIKENTLFEKKNTGSTVSTDYFDNRCFFLMDKISFAFWTHDNKELLKKRSILSGFIQNMLQFMTYIHVVAEAQTLTTVNKCV